MDILAIIEKKKNFEELTQEEISFFIKNYVADKIPDYQISSLLMAIRLNGLNNEEMVNLTKEIVDSGEQITYDEIGKTIVDKHSTGGVGDKTSLVLVPLLASLGFGVSKMSGRGLGFTGGTLDKLESIDGFNLNMSIDKIKESVKDIGGVIVGQSDDIVPADRKLYALRDVTGTVDSLGLIASSIMSKKIALGAHVILLDVKYGSGGFMKTYEDAKELAEVMKSIGNDLGRKVICFLSSMEEPLGQNIGNSMEVLEAYNTLNGEGNEELKHLCVRMAAEALVARDLISLDKANEMVLEAFDSKSALNKFKDIVVNQGGSLDSLENLEISSNVFEYKAKSKGYISEISTNKIGLAVMLLGAGRKTKEDKIDLTVGFEMFLKIGSHVNVGDTILKIYYNDEDKLNQCIKELEDAFVFSNDFIEKPELIKEIIK